MRYNFTFDVIKNRKKFFVFSIAITILGLITLLVFGLNTGVDFKAGTNLDVSIGKSTTKAEISELLKSAGAPKAPSITIGGDDNDHATIRFEKALTAKEITAIDKALAEKFGDKVTKEENTVDPAMAKELAQKAMVAVALASLGIILYVSIRFEWRFALAAIVALLHDAFIVISLFSILRLEVNLPFIVAILTIIGYSVNDTIVIFDRIRENLRTAKLKTFQDIADVANKSVWQTMTRSINTVFTVFIAATCLFIFGSEAIRLFSLAMIFGLVSGAYSSIFIASPIWLLLKSGSLKKAAVAKE